MTINIDEYKTAIVPIKKDKDVYKLEVHKSLWNDIQIYLLEGAKTKRIVFGFRYEELSPSI